MYETLLNLHRDTGFDKFQHRCGIIVRIQILLFEPRELSDFIIANSIIASLVREKQQSVSKHHLQKKEDDLKNQSCRLFVKNIQFQTTSRDLLVFFSRYGPVSRCYVLKEKHNRSRSRGLGYVTYQFANDAEKVVRLNPDDLYLDGRNLQVEYVRDRYRRSRKPPNTVSAEQLKPAVPSVSLPAFLPYDSRSDCSCTHIEDLNQDIMLHVFFYLSIREKVQNERVCRRWRDISRYSWRTLEKLEFSGVFKTFSSVVSSRVLCSLLRRGCPSLRSLDVSAAPSLFDDRSCIIIGQTCPNLLRLDLTGTRISNNGLKNLSQYCQKLERIILDRCLDVGEKGLWWLFHRCKELRFISLEGNVRVNGQCFHVLCHNLQSLNVNGCVRLIDIAIEKISCRSNDLKALYLNDCRTLTQKSLDIIGEKFTQLQTLHLAFLEGSPVGLNALGKLHFLEDLNLFANKAVDDVLLSVLTQSCKRLRCLNIAACYAGVTDSGVQTLQHCTDLEELNLSYLTKLQDSGLIKISSLPKLSQLLLRGCDGISNTGLSELVRRCPSLRELDISGNQQITMETLDSVMECIPINSNLVFTIGGTSIDPSSCQVPPSLTLVLQDLCSASFREHRDLYLNFDYDFDSDEEEPIEEGEFGYHDVETPPGGWNIPPSYYDDYFDFDDPLLEEEFELS